MMINVLNPMMLIKGHGIYTYHPNGPAMLRNPPAQNFRAYLLSRTMETVTPMKENSFKDRTGNTFTKQQEGNSDTV